MNPAWKLGLAAVIGAALLGGCSHPHHIKDGDCCGKHMKSYPFDENGEPIMPESEKSAKAGRIRPQPHGSEMDSDLEPEVNRISRK